ncbi:MAG: hypothetical protein ACFFG0_35665 [Candidatus Thorarchaeota archaeon]
MSIERSFFQNFKIGSLIGSIKLRFGIIKSVNESKNICDVFFGGEEGTLPCIYSHPKVGNSNNNIENVWGIYSPPTEESNALVVTFWGINYILKTFPPDNNPEGAFELWRSNNSLNIHRLPIADADKREDELSTNNNEDLVKKGELFFRSSGLADILLDYIGNILLDSHKQFSIRIGDRNGDNKIVTPEVQVDIGRIVDSNGADSDDKIKIKVYSVSGTTQTEKASLTIDKDGKIDISNEEITIEFNDNGSISIANITGGGEITMNSSTGQVSVNGNLTIDT